MPNSQPLITLDTVNAALRKMSLATALATLNRYGNMDGGELHVALGDDCGFYRLDAARPPTPCRVWVMSGRQPITCHGQESPDAYSSACTMVLGLKIAKAFGGKHPAAPGGSGKPWLDDLSLVMLRVKDGTPADPGSIPLARELFNRAMQHGVDMTMFRVYDNCEEHF